MRNATENKAVPATSFDIESHCRRDFATYVLECTVEIQSTFRNCENSQQLSDCLHNALETPLFCANIDNAKGIIEMKRENDLQVTKCMLSLVTQDKDVIACSASSNSPQVSINVAAKRGERLLRRLLRHHPPGISPDTLQVTNTFSSAVSRNS